MPQFSNPFCGNKCDREISEKELIRAIRFSIASEYEAIQFYEQLAESVTDKVAKKILSDVAHEEEEHAGEFLKLLEILNPDEIKNYEKGKSEVEEKFL
ncbi:MAG: rubrerythrin [bacterium]|nr:rubrerythrin [bacterium]